MGNNLMQADLSVWGMDHHADIVVKVVMIGLILASGVLVGRLVLHWTTAAVVLAVAGAGIAF